MTRGFFRHLRTKIFAGILVLLPIGLTFLVLKFVFNTLDSILGPMMPKVTLYLFGRIHNVPGLGIIAFFVMLYLMGVVTTNVLGRRLVHLSDRLFTVIPVVKNIYLASKQLADAFSATRKGAFHQAVFVEFPQEGNFVLGFLTNELRDPARGTKVTVYVPTAFIPPQGFLLFLPREKIIPSHLTIEEAIKTIMSVGIVTPNGMTGVFNHSSRSGGRVANSNEMAYVKPKAEGGL